MSVPVWHEVALDTLEIVHFGWRLHDSSTLEKLATSVRRHGQLRPIVVRGSGPGKREIVDGRKLWAVMRKVGLTRGMVVELGDVDAYAAQRVALDLETRFPTDYATLAYVVAGLVEQGHSPDSLAGGSPWSGERLGYMARLATWDWSQFSQAPAGQAALSWDEEAPVATPVPEVAPERPLEALPVPPETVATPEPVQMAEPLEPEVPVPAPAVVVAELPRAFEVPGPDGQFGLF